MLTFLTFLLLLSLTLLVELEIVRCLKLTSEEKKFIQAFRLRNADYSYPYSSFTPAQSRGGPQYLEWVMSENLTKWYTKFDLCMLNHTSSHVTIEERVEKMEQKLRVSVNEAASLQD